MHNPMSEGGVFNSSLIILCVRIDLLVHAMCKVVPLELVVSSIFWYVCDK